MKLQNRVNLLLEILFIHIISYAWIFIKSLQYKKFILKNHLVKYNGQLKSTR